MTAEKPQKTTETSNRESTVSTLETPQHTRRKLLKGAATIPVVMTLYSGAALARTSNITGEAANIDTAVFMDTSNGPQLLCVFPDAAQQQISGDTYDLGAAPQATLIQDPKINPIAASADKKKLEQLDACHAQGGIMISAVAYSSIMDKTGITINSTTL